MLRSPVALALACLLLLLVTGCSTSSSSSGAQTSSVGGGAGGGGVSGGGTGSSIGGGSGGSGVSGGGSGSGLPTTVSIAFAADSIDKNVFGMRVDSNGTSAETPGSPFSVPALAISVAVSGTMLAVSSNNSLGVGGAPHITTYNVDSNGVPTELMDAIVTDPGEITFSPDGKFLYLSALGQTFGYTLDPSTGAVAEVVGTPWQTGYNGARNPRVSQDGKTYCVASRLVSTNERVFCYARNTSTGVIRSTTEFVATAEPNPIPAFALTPDSRWAISVSSAFNHIDAGELSPTGARISTQGTGSGPTGLAVSPDGTLVVTPNSGSEDLSVYRFDTSTGNLFLIGKPIPLGAAGIKAAFSSDGKYLYVTTINTVVVFSVDSPGGAVSTLTGSPLNTGPAPTIVAAF